MAKSNNSGPAIAIAGRPIDRAMPPYIIAEMSANHGGDLSRALAIIEAAAKAGADAVKIQSYTPDTITIDHPGPDFQIDAGLWAGRNLHELYGEAQTPFEWHAELFAHAAALGITIFSSPFDDTAVALLEGLAAPAFKIASFELVDTPLIRRAARGGRPVILSTGLADETEITDAIDACGPTPVILLHCTSGYPTPAAEANVARIPMLRQRFGVPVGFSDHTMGSAAAVAATSLGAVLIEKHFTLSRQGPGADAAFSMQPDEFAEMAELCRAAHASLGKPEFARQPSEQAAQNHRRSLYVVADIAEGEALNPENIRSIRPGFGLASKFFDQVMEATASRGLSRGEALSWDMLRGVERPDG